MTNPGDFGFDLLPPDPGIISPDLALDAALAPGSPLDVPEEIPLGKGWAFDFIRNQFVRAGSSPAEVYGLDNLRIWIEKTLRTARYAHPIYSIAYGMEDPFRLIGHPVDDSALALFQDAVVDALIVHDRIVSVDSFFFRHDTSDDALYVSFTVTLDAAAEQAIQISSFPVTVSV